MAASAAAGKGVGPAAAVPRLQLLRDVMPQLHGRPGAGDGGAASTLPAVRLASDEAAVAENEGQKSCSFAFPTLC